MTLREKVEGLVRLFGEWGKDSAMSAASGMGYISDKSSAYEACQEELERILAEDPWIDEVEPEHGFPVWVQWDGLATETKVARLDDDGLWRAFSVRGEYICKRPDRWRELEVPR